jgi:ATP-dependent exoDNAse (exonuclease V) beta subunit
MNGHQPENILLKASAGSGKTHALSLRFLKFVLEPDGGRAAAAGAPGFARGSTSAAKARPLTRGPELQNVLAITFTKNAAREMKERILGWLKDACFGDPKRIAQLLEEIKIAPKLLPRRAGEAVERILDDYTDFQVETIDSFMATVFKASAVDLGFSPDFEIVLEHAELIDYAFYRYLRTIRAGSEEAAIFRDILDYLLLYQDADASFAWDPTSQVQEKLTSFYGRLTAQSGDLVIDKLDKEYARVIKKITAQADDLERAIEACGLEKSARSHFFARILPAIREKRWSGLVGSSFKTAPIKKPPGRGKAGAGADAFDRIEARWRKLEKSVHEYGWLYARDFFSPYLKAYRALAGTLDRVKRQQGIVFIEDINKQLARYMDAGIVPDIYFRLGDRIDHYLIDEFQDTSPLQWTNLRPLIEESLSKGGSLFVVGDTKQAIYGFRDADFRIMKGLEEGRERFPSAEIQVRELRTNYRSGEAILDFVKRVFQSDSEYRDSAGLSGLNEFHQDVVQDHKGGGYVEYVLLDKEAEEGDHEDEDPGSVEGPEKAKIQSLIADLVRRGYAYSDIAILTYKNESVVDIAAWLNEMPDPQNADKTGVPFIPFSSLDIRGRKIIVEILALLRFLDSPPDDLSFAAFLLGDIFAGAAGGGIASADLRRFLFDARRESAAVYTAFRKRYKDAWDRFFEPLFKAVGYYPLYDLAVSIDRAFDLFRRFPGEEAALAKFLEAIKNFEGRGRNDLREFLDFTSDGGGEGWTIDVPSEIDAVKIMTIHKAKGLGFPVVLLLLYGEKWMAPDFYLDAGEGDSGSGTSGGPGWIRVYKINKALAEADARLRVIYEEARRKDEVNRLNTLYVALTRAEAELYVIGVKSPRAKFPFDLLGKPFTSADMKPPVRRRAKEYQGEAAPTERPAGPFELPPNPRDSLNYRGRRRGELAHRILAGLEFVSGGWDEALSVAVDSLRPGEAEAAAYVEIARSLAHNLGGSPIAAFFEPRPDRRVMRELTFCGADGRAYRMDRVVIDPDAVHIIDYKTGAEGAGSEGDEGYRDRPEESDRAQVREYIRIIRDVFPGRSVRGVLAYVDRRRWETVE